LTSNSPAKYDATFVLPAVLTLTSMFFSSSSGTGTVTFVLPAGSLSVCELAGLVNANCRPACWAKGLRPNNSSAFVGMVLIITVTTFCQLTFTPAALTDTSIAGSVAASWPCALFLTSALASRGPPRRWPTG
jgi:hypothetical protein